MKAKKDLDWKPLYGLSKHLWKGEDAQAAVDRMRAERSILGSKVKSFKLGVKKEYLKRSKIY